VFISIEHKARLLGLTVHMSMQLPTKFLRAFNFSIFTYFVFVTVNLYFEYRFTVRNHVEMSFKLQQQRARVTGWIMNTPHCQGTSLTFLWVTSKIRLLWDWIN